MNFMMFKTVTLVLALYFVSHLQISRFLVVDPVKRITVREALKHEFFQGLVISDNFKFSVVVVVVK